MNRRRVSRSQPGHRIVFCLFALVLAGATTPVAAGIKCWTNKEGVRECGNAVPPEYAQAGHEEKSSSGMTVRKQTRAKTPAEVAAERAEREAATKLQAQREAEQRRQAAADKVLLDTFGSEDDLKLARDGQILNIDSQVKLTEGHIAKLQKSLDQMIGKAADHERRNQPVPKDLAENMDSVRSQIAEHRRFISDKHAEKEALHRKFEQDIARFRELRSAQK